jgi:hypothetical protein
MLVWQKSCEHALRGAVQHGIGASGLCASKEFMEIKGALTIVLVDRESLVS